MTSDSARVFDAVARVDSSPARHAESNFAFLNRAAGAIWDEVRALIDDWFLHLPDAARADVRGRLRAGDDRQFDGAFWELYLHESLRRAGCCITIHPEVGGSSRQPDFLVTLGDSEFYLEAKSMAGVDQQGSQRGASARRLRLYDEVNKLNHPDFYLEVEIRTEGQADPRGRQIRQALKEWLDGLDPDETKFSDNRWTFLWASDGWEIAFRPIPVSADARGRPNKRLIGVYPTGVAVVTDDRKLRNALADKGSAYGNLEHPLVVAISVNTIRDVGFDVMNALYGSLRYTFDTANPELPWVQTRAHDGYWAAGSWQHQHVAAVLIGRSVAPESVARGSPTLWHHPQANPSVPALPPWRQAVAAVDHIEFVEPAGSIADFFGLQDPWPTAAAREEWTAAND